MEKKQRGKRLAEYRTDYVVFDLETTGLSPVSDAIVEISGIKVKAGKVTGNFSMLVNPGRSIPYGAIAVHGITDDMVKDAPCIAQALGDFLKFAGDMVLVGHNIHTFDMKFLYEASGKELNKTVAMITLIPSTLPGDACRSWRITVWLIWLHIFISRRRVLTVH